LQTQLWFAFLAFASSLQMHVLSEGHIAGATTPETLLSFAFLAARRQVL